MNRPAGNLSLLLRPTLPAPAKLPLRPRAPIQKPERRAFLFLQGPSFSSDQVKRRRKRVAKTERVTSPCDNWNGALSRSLLAIRMNVRL